jgi:hypothetical protein
VSLNWRGANEAILCARAVSGASSGRDAKIPRKVAITVKIIFV